MAEKIDNIQRALLNVNRHMRGREQKHPISFDEYLKILEENPTRVLRNIFQVFHDMVKSYVAEGADEYPDDPESIHYASYDCSKLFVEGVDHPFFADRLFANRLIRLIESLQRGAQQNKIYIFEGPHGCGKSTFLNNMLMRFETYANTPEGLRHEAVWRLDRRVLGSFRKNDTTHFLDKLTDLLDEYELDPDQVAENKNKLFAGEDFVEIPCPSHDSPILMIPKDLRRSFLDDLIKNDEQKWRLFTSKEFEWVFNDLPCTICSSLYRALTFKLDNPREALGMLYTRPFSFNRRLGEGISVFNPGDKPMKQTVLTNEMLQRRINALLRDSNQVQYLFSHYAKTNNGVYALMDIKSQNTERLIELHNIISEGVHKVEQIEENVTSLLLAVMNPEDQKNIEGFQSFLDRIEYIKIPYVLDLNTEVEIYRHIFGKQIEESFLPRVLHNFARVIISTRLNKQSENMKEWIGDPAKYSLYCDENLQLLKMEIYTGHIPEWLSTEDRKRLTAKRRRRIIGESEFEGNEGFSGRDAIKIFNELYSTFSKTGKLINMAMLKNFFTKTRKELSDAVSGAFLDSLMRMYNYTVLQEVKESLYYYNEDQINRDIQNYLFGINFEPGTQTVCQFTGERINVSDDFFRSIEIKLLGAKATSYQRGNFRKETQKEYASRTLTQEMMLEGRPLTETQLFSGLYERYVHHLKEKVLDPFLENENFRSAIRDSDKDTFRTYDKKIRDDVNFLLDNLCEGYRYSRKGAKEVCMYVIDNDLAKEFGNSP